MKVSIIGTLIAGIVATSLFNQAEANVGVTATTISVTLLSALFGSVESGCGSYSTYMCTLPNLNEKPDGTPCNKGCRSYDCTAEGGARCIGGCCKRGSYGKKWTGKDSGPLYAYLDLTWNDWMISDSTFFINSIFLNDA